ncbi:MAG: hypothetical protein AB4080_00125 [Trichodesmium sp.]
MRIYLYILSGITSALIGWSLGQFILSDLGWLKKFPELALFPCIAISLAVGIVAIDIFLSNPTRFKRNFNRGLIPLSIAIGLGFFIGISSGGLVQILLNPLLRDKVITIPDKLVRIVGWILIGGAVGLAEGWTWRWRSIEAGDKRRFLQRLTISLSTSILTALVAAIIFEILREKMGGMPTTLKAWEDPIGFSLLGGLLGLVLSFSTSPSHLVALRAGAGFEYTENVNINQPQISSNYPHIQKELLPKVKFVSNNLTDKIEEGLSIQLPARGKVKIGSAKLKILGNQQFGVNICIPGLPLHIADLDLEPSQTILVPNLKFFSKIEYQGEPLKESTPIKLKHNDLITFHAENGVYNGKKLFRFVYYNRFLDPQS